MDLVSLVAIGQLEVLQIGRLDELKAVNSDYHAHLGTEKKF
jgi:hypothetical protein